MTPRIQKAIDIFLDAINEGTLAKGTCKACAVGNLVANALNIKIVVPKNINEDCISTAENEHWFGAVGVKAYNDKFLDLFPMELLFDPLKGLESINKTDFTIDEITLIEDIFEKNTTIPFFNYHLFYKEDIREDQIKGLEAVVKAMLQFDDCKENVEESFTNKAKLIPILN